jgi:hypothetical protein
MQTDSRTFLRQTEAKRLDLLASIGKKRQSAVIAYVATTRSGIPSHPGWNDMHVIEPHVRAAREQGLQDLDLFLISYGGASVAPWDIAAMIREYIPGSLRVIIPSVAYGAGTLLALGADEIIMGLGSILGPVDSQISWPSGSGMRKASASDFQSFLEFVRDQGLTSREIHKKIPEWCVSGVDAPVVGALYRMVRENERVVDKMLGSRRRPLLRNSNAKIGGFLLNGTGEHGRSIRRTEARKAGLSFITDIEETDIECDVSELHAIYSDIFKLGIRHAHSTDVIDKYDLRINDHDASGPPIAIVESLYDTNPAYTSYGLRHVTDVAPAPVLAHKERQPLPLAGEPTGPKAQRDLGDPSGIWVSARNVALAEVK